MSSKKIHSFGGKGKMSSLNAINATKRFNKKWGNDIAQLSSAGLEDIKEHIIKGNFFDAAERFKRIAFDENVVAAHQAMGQIICEFYTHQMAGQWVSENGFYLREHMSISECRDFLNEMHKIYTQFEHHKKT